MLFVPPHVQHIVFAFYGCLIFMAKSKIQRAAPTHGTKRHARKKQP